MSRFDPRIRFVEPWEPPEVPADRLKPDTLVLAVKDLQRYFAKPCFPRIGWARSVETATLELVTISPKGSVLLHPILGHEKAPKDVFEAAVFLGMLLWFGKSRQRKLEKHVMDEPELAEWVDLNMTIHPGATFLAIMIEKFDRWVSRL